MSKLGVGVTSMRAGAAGGPQHLGLLFVRGREAGRQPLPARGTAAAAGKGAVCCALQREERPSCRCATPATLAGVAQGRGLQLPRATATSSLLAASLQGETGKNPSATSMAAGWRCGLHSGRQHLPGCAALPVTQNSPHTPHPSTAAADRTHTAFVHRQQTRAGNSWSPQRQTAE